MTFLVERLVDLRKHLDHLRDLRPRVPDRHALEHVVEALDRLEPIERFAEIVRRVESST